MNSAKSEILIKNIIQCSADAKLCSAEIDLLMSDFLFDQSLSHKSISDIKNEINWKYEVISEERRKQNQEISFFESVREKISICKSYYEHIKGKSSVIFDIPSNFLNFVKIAYWHTNIYAKEALEKFSKQFEHCEEIIAESFTSVCEIIQDDTTFGIIPIINSSDGRLIPFYRILDRFDLKISAVCRIDNPGNDGFTKFALVGKKLSDISSNSQKTIEFSVTKRLPEYVCHTVMRWDRGYLTNFGV